MWIRVRKTMYCWIEKHIYTPDEVSCRAIKNGDNGIQAKKQQQTKSRKNEKEKQHTILCLLWHHGEDFFFDETIKRCSHVHLHFIKSESCQLLYYIRDFVVVVAFYFCKGRVCLFTHITLFFLISNHAHTFRKHHLNECIRFSTQNLKLIRILSLSLTVCTLT